MGNGLSDRQLRETMELLEGVDFSVNVISKSGTTTEPAVAFRFFRELLEKKYGPEGGGKAHLRHHRPAQGRAESPGRPGRV